MTLNIKFLLKVSNSGTLQNRLSEKPSRTGQNEFSGTPASSTANPENLLIFGVFLNFLIPRIVSVIFFS